DIINGGDEQDGLDEALVLYNAPLTWPKDGKYEGEHHYVDDQLKTKLDKIRSIIGGKGQVVAVIDACHSGTSTRGSGDPAVRGTKMICAPENWKPNTSKDKSEGFGTDNEYKNSEDQGKLVAFFGCKSDQVNNEHLPLNSTIRYGSLTYFFLEGMKKLEKNASYSNLFAEIRKNMLVSFSGKQIPEIEGDN
ncbi:MAG: caspase family protein, partial [Bacteroidota bacterium]